MNQKRWIIFFKVNRREWVYVTINLLIWTLLFIQTVLDKFISVLFFKSLRIGHGIKALTWVKFFL